MKVPLKMTMTKNLAVLELSLFIQQLYWIIQQADNTVIYRLLPAHWAGSF
jgi:hypothetical protein